MKRKSTPVTPSIPITRVGRLLDAIREEGQADKPSSSWIFGDNGASAEGGLEGHDARTRMASPKLSKSERISPNFSAANST